jgi:dTMP kinase
MHKGLFITFEGTDGSGKTTQIALLTEYMQSMGHEPVTLREPGGVAISERIRSVVLDNRHTEMDEVTEMLLYAAARAQLVAQVILPALNAGKSVICDRFVDSSYIYQGFARGLGLETVKAVNDIATRNLMPDITFFMDVDPQVALKRRYDNSQPDRLEMEGVAFHQKVYEGYVRLCSLFPERMKRISGMEGIEASFIQIKSYMNAFLCR